VPAGPTAAAGTNTTQFATTAFTLANRNTGIMRFVAEASQNPTDGAVAYFGTFGTVGYTNTADIRRVPFIISGVIKTYVIWIRTAGTLGSGESSTLELRVNGATLYTIHSAIKFDAVSTMYIVTGLSIPVVADGAGYAESKLTFANFATNPTNVNINGYAFVEPA
jgi:hypothetical protein